MLGDKGRRNRHECLLGESLCGRVVHKFNPLLNAAFETRLAGLEKLLLVIIQLRKDVGGLFCSGRLGTV